MLTELLIKGLYHGVLAYSVCFTLPSFGNLYLQQLW